jgi:hypothetical protein
MSEFRAIVSDFARREAARIVFTSSSYVRSHGKEPRGVGCWVFQASSSTTAFASELSGDTFEAWGTFAAAKQEARMHFVGRASVVAVLS